MPDNPEELRYLLPDDLYLLPQDAAYYREPRQPEPAMDEVTVPLPIEIKAMGSNAKNFLVVGYYPSEDFMTEAHLAALESTFKRKDLVLDDLALVNLAAYPDATWPALITQFKPQRILLLGSIALPADAPALNMNQVQTAENVRVLYTYSFDEMLGNKENTKTFWNQIKNF